MPAADGLLANVKPRARGWTADELRQIAAAGTLHGSGKFLLTNRANLQVRGLSSGSAGAFAAAMLAAGLASGDRDAERRRNILMADTQTPESEAVAEGLESWLEAERALAELPAKFCFGVSSGTTHGECAAADFCLHVLGEQAWLVLGADGVGVLTENPLRAAAAITRAFLHLAGTRQPRPRRLRDLVADVGIDTVFAAAGLATTEASHALPQREPGRAFEPRRPGQAGPWVGQSDGCRFGVGVPFGRADAAMLYAVADLAERFGCGRLRLTTHRTFVLLGTKPEEASELSARATRAGFIVDDRDTRLRVVCCAGGSGCDRTTVDIHAVAATLAPLWRGEGILHVSGCPKGCAHPRPAVVTVLAGGSDDRFFVLSDSRADAVASHAANPNMKLSHPSTLSQVRELLIAHAGRRSGS